MEPAKKHAGGRPRGRKIAQALEKAGEAFSSIQEMEAVVDQMNPQQKILFESLMAGDDALIAVLKSDHTEYFTGITKKLYLEDESEIYSSSVTIDNVHDLRVDSYSRLLRICESKVRSVTGQDDYRKHTEPIKEYIKRFVPLAFGTVVSIAQSGIKEENRLKAANSILDRAGESPEPPEKDIVVPVQVNIMLTDKDGRTVEFK